MANNQKQNKCSDLEKDYGPSLTMSVPEAGWKYYGLKRVASYAAAKRGAIITVNNGNRMRAVTAAMDAKMAQAAEEADT